jgi:hypothetical protein
MCMCVYTHVRACIHVCICGCVSVSVCLYVCVCWGACVRMFVWVFNLCMCVSACMRDAYIILYKGIEIPLIMYNLIRNRMEQNLMMR